MTGGKSPKVSTPDLQFSTDLHLALEQRVEMERKDLAEPETVVVPNAAVPPVGLIGHDGLLLRLENQWQAFFKATDTPHPGMGNPQLPAMAPSVDFKTFLSTFEGPSVSSQQSREGHPTSLYGSAQQLHGWSDAREMVDPRTMKEERYGEEAFRLEAQRLRFRHFCYCEAVGAREICGHLWELCLQWLRPDWRTMEEILELLVLEQFLTILPQGIQRWVRERSPVTCAQAVALVEGFLPMQQEARQWDPQNPGIFQNMAVNIPHEEAAPLGSAHRQIWNGVKQEVDLASGIGSATLVVEECEGKNEICGQERSEEEEEEQHGMSKKKAPKNGTKHCKQPEVLENLHGARKKLKSGLKRRMERSLHGMGSFQDLREIVEEEQVIPVEQSANLLTQERKKKKRGRKKKEEEESLHICVDCGKSFQGKDKLIRHNNSHTGEKPYECLDCGKFFSTKYGLFRHFTIHRGEKPFECSSCGKFFRTNYHLLRHQRIHVREKTLKRSRCRKSFGMNSDLVKHQRILAKEKPNTLKECLDCGKTFSVKGNLAAHAQNHVGRKPFGCGECGKSFDQTSKLKAHMKIHTR